jgi:hypothetical protein
LGLGLAYVVSRAITRCDVVHVDAVRSVRAAFTIAELRQMATQADLADATITRCWPARMLLTWDRKVG